MHEPYCLFLKEYFELGHLTTVRTNVSYLLLHHPVFEDTSSTTKMEVAFNGSALLLSGESLNSLILVGSKLQKLLLEVLTKFRTYMVALSADVKMMYRQILIRPENRCHQHVLWCSNYTEEISKLQLTTVIYGLTSSLFLAQRVIQQLLLDEGHHYSTTG